MSAITTPATSQVHYSPTAAFATTLAGAERRARAAAAAAAAADRSTSPLRRLIDRLVSPRS